MDVSLLQTIIDMLPATISIKDSHRRYLFVNRGWERSAGLASEQVLGRSWEELAPPEIGAGSRDGYANDIGLRDTAVLTQGTAVADREETYLDPAGKRMTRLSSKSPLTGPDGAIWGLLSVTFDISELKRTEQLLAEANREAEVALERLRSTQASLIEAEKLASLGGLVAGMAHEINTPIGVALTAVSHLEEQATRVDHLLSTGEARESDLRALVENAVDTTRLTLSNLSRAADLITSFKQIAVDQTSDRPFRFPLRSYVEEIIASMRPTLEQGGHRVGIDCPEDLIIESHPGPLAQIIGNLVINSTIHAYDPGVGGTLSIAAADAGDDGAWVRIIYRDDGRGIPPEHLGKVFDPFFTTRRGRGSTGLGLNMVYNLVKHRLLGSISVDSVPGKGVTFVITIPKSVAPPG